MTYRISEEKWILYRHTNNFNLICEVALLLKYDLNSSISKEKKQELLLKLKESGLYNERNKDLPLDSINHRINTLANYMFGYKDTIFGEKKFLFSPLGNLFLKHINDKQKSSLIFLTMLWAIQFEHPHGGSSNIFQLYPFRLIFKLLLDDRLDMKLYSYEVSYLVMFCKDIDQENYEHLVNDILKLRSKSNSEIEYLFKENEHLYVNAVYERDYYTSKVLESSGLIEKIKGDKICNLNHGKSTKRVLYKNYVKVNNDIINYCKQLLEEHPYYETPIKLNDPERLKIDVIKQIYSFYPKILLSEIGEENQELENILQLPKLIEEYSNNNNGEEAYLFEEVLTEGFNMFYNVEAKLIGGAGNTDIECLYLNNNKKFSVDAKSTKNKLSGINAGRLKRHRDLIGGEYTIVVTPRYVPSVKYDIQDTKIVIILASTFSEYLYNNIINKSEIDYQEVYEIINSNLGKDISKHISNLTFEKFGLNQ